ncbi:MULTISPECIES: hypothetical protein [unclassified Streptomyces]|uniref:hypothetical protein n=1 Tax=unclassified Streptomyces TaxID=2593676 RepID=UPI00225B0D80|nr:hypothetical protein [Streptomyces sp. NBC_00047]MCX5610529.1 hypothetical protein [Streptomyces sp. NBC_00047]
MPDAVTSALDATDVDLLDDLCRELAEAADAVGEAAGYASRLALGARLPATALTRGGLRRHGWRTLLRTLTDPAGLGWAPRGRGIARAGRLAGTLTGRESLAISVAVCGLRARIRVANARRPELLRDPGAAAVLGAVAEGRQAEAVRLFRRIMRERGAEHAFSLLTPAFADILAWHALTDANPFNDHAGWQVATGRAVPAAPLLGLGAAFRAFCDRGPGLPAGKAGKAGNTEDAGNVTEPSRPAPRRLRAVPPMGPDPYRHPHRPGSLRGHAAALRSHTVRLRATLAAPAWRVPQDDALRAEVATLAGRCATAANGFTMAAAQLGEERLPG